MAAGRPGQDRPAAATRAARRRRGGSHQGNAAARRHNVKMPPGGRLGYRTSEYEADKRTTKTAARQQRIGREDVDKCSGPASVVWDWFGRRVGGLGPGLTCYSADAAGCLRIDLS